MDHQKSVAKYGPQFKATSNSSWKNMASRAGGTIIYLFRNDLRLHDNEALYEANKKAVNLLPLYCFDPRHYGSTYHFGIPKTGGHRLGFLIDSIKDLQNNLQSRGSNLIIKKGKPEKVIPELLKSLNVGNNASIVFQKEVTDEEVKVEKAIEASVNIPVVTTWGHTLYHVDDLPFKPNQLPDVYTQFRQKVEGTSYVRKCINIPDRLKPLPNGVDSDNIPTSGELGLDVTQKDSQAAFPFPGGETSALERLNSYLWATNNVCKYKATRNGMIGPDYSTKFSPWLAHGCLSPRKIYWEIQRYEKERVANKSTYWVIFELLWRDYFRFVGLKYGNRLFHSGGIKGHAIQWKVNLDQFSAWKDGRTGVPYVDANMRELKATGFMSNRGRQNVASFLVKDLHLDWRLGAEWFESMLMDHDVTSNYGNWLYSAGIGNDPRENRKFNVVKQGLDYDPDGDYVRMWVPELAEVKTGSVHFVWTLNPGLLSKAGVALGETYPHPIVKAPEWSRHFNRTGSTGSAGIGARGQSSSQGRGQSSSQGRGRSRGGQSQSVGQQRGIDFYFSSKSH